MKKAAAEGYRDIDFTAARRGAVVVAGPGKTKISIRLDNTVLGHFRSVVEKAGGGNYQTAINDALIEYIRQRSMLAAVRQVVREEIAGTPRARTRDAGTRRKTARRAPSTSSQPS
jgi:uncharacterized protein (DUF4415 family)